jgi:hypothetical protein
MAVTATFLVRPAGSATIFCNSNEVTGRSVELGRDEQIHIHLEPASGYVLENWNEGQWFDEDWDLVLTENRAFIANMING